MNLALRGSIRRTQLEPQMPTQQTRGAHFVARLPIPLVSGSDDPKALVALDLIGRAPHRTFYIN